VADYIQVKEQGTLPTESLGIILVTLSFSLTVVKSNM
jgi:hypothetical protein